MELPLEEKPIRNQKESTAKKEADSSQVAESSPLPASHTCAHPAAQSFTFVPHSNSMSPGEGLGARRASADTSQLPIQRQRTSDSFGHREILESLESLKHVSLQALNSLVKRIVLEERNEVIPETQSIVEKENIPTPELNESGRLGASFSKFFTSSNSKLGSGNSQSKLSGKRPHSFQSTSKASQEELDAAGIKASASTSNFNALQKLGEAVKKLSESGLRISKSTQGLNQSASNVHDSNQILNIQNMLSTSQLISPPNGSMANIQISSPVEPASPEVERPQSPSSWTDHELALALAALCNGLYKLLETEYIRYTPDENAPHQVAFQEPNMREADINQSIIDKVEALQVHRPSIMEASKQVPEEEQLLWSELDRLMVVIKTICEKREVMRSRMEADQLPPSYEQATQKRRSTHFTTETNPDLVSLIGAIDRVFKNAPRLNAQAFTMTEQKEKKISGAALAVLVEKLLKKDDKFEEQRVDTSQIQSKYSTLNKLVSGITTAHKRSLENQRAVLSPVNVEKIEMGKIGKVLDRQEKARFSNQDWISPEQKLIEDLEKLHNELESLSKTISQSHASSMTNQRFVMSDQKERNMFMTSVLSKMDKMGTRRLNNQDSMTPAQIKQEKFDEIDKLMDRMAPTLQDQRASMIRSPSANSGPMAPLS